jgi:dihydrofolate reductase
MGAKTYEQTLSFNYWYGNMEGIVFTTRELPPLEGKKIQFHAGDPTAVIKQLRENKKDSWLVGGSSLISQFINKSLLDEMIITVVPRLLGKGSLLCPEIKEVSRLTFIENKTYKDGVIQLRYKF